LRVVAQTEPHLNLRNRVLDTDLINLTSSALQGKLLAPISANGR